MRIIEVEINTKLDGKWYYLAKAKVHFLNMKNLLAHKDYIFVVKERTKKDNRDQVSLIIIDLDANAKTLNNYRICKNRILP